MDTLPDVVTHTHIHTDGNRNIHPCSDEDCHAVIYNYLYTDSDTIADIDFELTRLLRQPLPLVPQKQSHHRILMA